MSVEIVQVVVSDYNDLPVIRHFECVKWEMKDGKCVAIYISTAPPPSPKPRKNRRAEAQREARRERFQRANVRFHRNALKVSGCIAIVVAGLVNVLAG